jgi:hypothetical protein
MKTDCLFRIVATIQADADSNIITYVRELADQMMAIYADIDRAELTRIIQNAIVVVH